VTAVITSYSQVSLGEYHILDLRGSVIDFFFFYGSYALIKITRIRLEMAAVQVLQKNWRVSQKSNEGNI